MTNRVKVRGGSRYWVRGLYVSPEGKIKKQLHALVDAKLKEDVDEVCRRLNLSISQFVERALRFYMTAVQVLGREPSEGEVLIFFSSLKQVKKLVHDALTSVNVPELESEEETKVVSVLYQRYLMYGQKYVLVRDDSDLMEIFDMAPETVKSTLMKLENKRIAFVRRKRDLGVYKIGLYTSFIEKLSKYLLQTPQTRTQTIM
ncbi:MAG: hypothetical protein DRJ40_11845 [Thermoprotei archaeon]|nr:MAG: hypothetical protein DRJ40_11845 [Thermoprotei archaeon]